MLLLTGFDGGAGVSRSNFYCVAEGGPGVASLPSSYQDSGIGPKWSDMQTALHEVGHSFLTLGGSNEHNSGNVYYNLDTRSYHRTPMGHGGGTGKNYCNNDIPANHDFNHEWMWYDPDCAVNHFKNTTTHY